MDNIWTVILHKLDDNKLIVSENNPAKSGEYLCTCVEMWYSGEEARRRLQVMYYEKDGNYWRDCDGYRCSHNILAWTDKIKPCEFSDYQYIAGGYFVEKSGGEK